MKRICYIFFCVNFIISCSAHTVKQTATTEPTQVVQIRPQQSKEKSFDFSVLNDPWIIEPRTYELTIQPYTEPVEILNATTDKETSIIGYRVQLISTTDYYEALEIRDSVTTRLSGEIYLDYEPPYYKVRAGNFTQRDDAEIKRAEAKQAGYPDAWIVRTKIIQKK